jgi:mono/diheme cytochrome c family protein
MSLSKHFGSFQSVYRPIYRAIFQKPRSQVLQLTIAFLFAASSLLSGCVMSEEMKRINAVKKAQQERQESGSTNLTGEQIFIRTCNTCHPGGSAGMGPSLENLAKDFPDDAKLKLFLRQGKGIMPPQPKDVLNDQEMDNLVGYLRALEVSK